MRILLIEDDRKAARLLAGGLEEEGFVVDAVHSAAAGDEQAFVVDYDVIILDWMLPDKEGLALCGDLRKRGCQTPVLMLTARDALADRVAGLNQGADDYLTKPFAFDELLARVRALLRRSETVRPVVMSVGDVRLDSRSQSATRAGAPLDLTHKEFSIMEVLMRHAGRVVSRTRLAEQVWKDDLVGIDNLIDVHIGNLRRKLDLPGMQPLIQTVRGRGFRLVDQEAECA